MNRLTFALVLIGCCSIPAPAEAQILRTCWGLTATGTPSWSIPSYQHVLFDANEAHVSGREFTFGFVRGLTLKGDWGLSLVRRWINNGSSISRDTNGTLATTIVTSSQLQGVEISGFIPAVTIKERVQIGVSLGVGAGVMKGTAVSSTPSGDQPVPSSKFFAFFGKSLPVVPTFRIELAGSAILTAALKIRATGGICAPGQRRISIGLVYLFGAHQ